MRWWNFSRQALENRFDRQPYTPWGVYDRQPSSLMFFVRAISAFFAISAFLVGFSVTVLRQSHRPHYPTTYPNQPAFIPLAQPAHIQLKSHPTYRPFNATHIVLPDRTELVFQISPYRQRGTILLLHGCSHSATHFFPPAPGCSQCIGLPEELAITKTSLYRGYSVLAVSSTDRKSKCWSPHACGANGNDFQRIASSLRAAQQYHVYAPHLPLFAVGVSSGAFFATSLPSRFRIGGVNAIVSGAIFSSLQQPLNPNPLLYPPHVFTHMANRDSRTAAAVQRAMSHLRRIRVPTIQFKVSPKQITPRYLHTAVPCWEMGLTQKVVSSLKAGSFLDDRSFLILDPRRSHWRSSVIHLQETLRDSFVPDKSPLSEELNRAWAGHEITSEYFADTLDFLEANILNSSIQRV